MMIKPFPHDKGDGTGPTRYLMRLDYHGRKESPPLVLRSDPDMTRDLIDSIDREWKFTAGVCSWGPEDTVTPEQEIQVMNNFETVAFASMQPDQYNILWVRHSHAGHHELHFVIPRMELSTGKAFNAFPPGWEKAFGPLRDLENTRHGWTRPDEPERARLFAPSTADIIEAQAGWRHTYGKVDNASSFTFAEGGSHFGIKGSTVNRDEAVLDLRAEYKARDNLRLGLEANAAIGARGTNIRGGAFVALEW